ncbi:MAG TPA: fumarylacetoacetate hydrolase family protein [Devosia sp.]
MADYVFPPAVTAAPTVDGALFPVRRIYCVGRNYAEHAREMGHDPDEAPPFFFSKPADALVTAGADTPYPSHTEDLHHEIELVAALGGGGANIAVGDALSYVWGYAAGIDMTRRDVQATAKKGGRPWEMAKGFDHSAPIGPLVPAMTLGEHPAAGAITLKVNGTLRQEGDIADMIWDLAHVISHLSQWVELKRGDLIFTGTPAGVGAVVRGDLLEGEIAGIGAVRTRIV